MKRTWLLAGLLACAQAAGAQEAGVQMEIDQHMLTEGFLSAHPDIRWQREGMNSFEQGRYELALTQLKRAALHADKLSQAMIANIYWEGHGVAVDRPLAYAWMDIAAERLYPSLVQFREQYWAALDRNEREEALLRGREILHEYGDAAAKPRLEQVMTRERRRGTGSRVGASLGMLRVIPMTGPGRHMGFGEMNFSTANAMRGDQFYADEFWQPEAYWRMQDKMWDAPEREGHVDVGAPVTVPQGDKGD